MFIYAAIALVGLLLAAFANWAIYSLAYFPRPIGPWQKGPAPLTARTWADAIPVVGWLRMRREASHFGRLFWFRPLLIEILFPVFLVWLYQFEMAGGLLSDGPMQSIVTSSTRTVQFVIHGVLILFLLVATCIDFDERCIPDTVTLPGTLLALFGAALVPNWHLAYLEPSTIGETIRPMHAMSPYAFPIGWYGSDGLWLAWLSYTAWCFALADRRWITRRGWKKAMTYFFAGLVRHWTWKLLLAIWLVGSLLLFVAHGSLPNPQWQSLFSSLIGMTVGCSIVWMIRLIAGAAMRMEAMGFGDVTLMAMVGAFLGWQVTWISFFAGAVLAMFFVLAMFIVTRDNTTPFGPYLALGTVVVLIQFDAVWNGWAIPRIMTIGGSLLFWGFLSFLVLLGGTLWGWLQLKYWFLDQLEKRSEK